MLVCLEGFEPPTYWFVASHSIQLSYRHIFSMKEYIPLAEICQAFFVIFTLLHHIFGTGIHKQIG